MSLRQNGNKARQGQNPAIDDVNLRATALKMAMEAGTSQGLFWTVKSESPEKHVARAKAYYEFLTGMTHQEGPPLTASQIGLVGRPASLSPTEE